MPLFMTQSSYTNETWAEQVKNPADRSAYLKKLFEKFGGRMIGMYYCTGDYDVVVISEFPDHAAASAALYTVLASGTLRDIKTSVLYDVKHGMEAMAKAGKMLSQATSK
jgi:uncharacterized protein with GYD domain